MPSEIILLLGVNHKNTPLEVREKLALSSGYEEPLQALGKIDGLREYYLLSTCNRVEILVSARDGDDVEKRLAEFFLATLLAPISTRSISTVIEMKRPSITCLWLRQVLTR